MRLFLGIDIPDDSKKQLYDGLGVLRGKHPDFRWVSQKNYHITLHFFGEIAKPKDVAKRIGDILFDAESFYLTSLNMDIFVHKQLLLYLKFKSQKKLRAIDTKIRSDLGIDEKMEFVPHITLSRSSLSSKQQYFALNNEIEKTEIELDFYVDKLYLFESIITDKQPIYNKVAEFRLLKKR